MTWTHLPLGNKTSRFTQSALALMIASTLPRMREHLTRAFWRMCRVLISTLTFQCMNPIKLNTCQVNTASRWWSTKKMESRTWSLRQRQRRSAQKWVNPGAVLKPRAA